MKQQMMEYTRWQLWRKLLACGLGSAGNRKLTVFEHRKLTVCATTAAMLFFALSAHAQSTVILPPLGGHGGAQFVLRCPEGRHLTGFELRTGDDVDAIQPICVGVYGPAEFAGPPEPYYANWGGNGQLVCPAEAPIVIGMKVKAEGVDAIVVNSIHLWCGTAASTQQLSALPNATFDGPVAVHESSALQGYRGVRRLEDTQYCPAGMVAIGINGRTGYWLDAVGLICGAPKLTPRPIAPVYQALGRVKPAGTLPSRSICESARDARARNSPAAPGLEAQCLAAVNALAAKGEAIANQDPFALALRNQQPAGLARRGFDIGMAAAEGQTAPGPGKQSIHDSLSPAEQVGFNAAVSFSLERNRNLERNKNDALAAKGKAIANQDPLAVALRNRQPDDPSRRGFDIGMAAAEGQTAPGPGKQRLLESLDQAERGGFSIAVSFSLERNKNAVRAAKGADIAKVDPIVANARTAEADVFYKLGFDIATGMFGDPAQGAEGKTATGPGSLGTRDSLSLAGRRGFNAAVKLHLGRKYGP